MGVVEGVEGEEGEEGVRLCVKQRKTASAIVERPVRREGGVSRRSDRDCSGRARALIVDR